jgi:hypothetical protein
MNCVYRDLVCGCLSLGAFCPAHLGDEKNVFVKRKRLNLTPVPRAVGLRLRVTRHCRELPRQKLADR